MPLNLDFQTLDRDKWEELIAKALKINTLDDFQSKNIAGVELPAFNHPSEKIQRENPLISHIIDWKIAVSVDTSRPDAHSSIMNAVQNGAEAIVLQGEKMDWEPQYEGVFYEMIYNDIQVDAEPDLLADFIAYSQSQQKKLEELSGAFSISKDTLKANVAAAKQLPGFHFITGVSSSANIPEALHEIADQLREGIELVSELALPISCIRACVSVDAHMPVNVAKLRALRIVWANLLKAHKKEFQPLFIKVITTVNPDVNQETALIENTSACINAALGMADMICSFHNEDSNQARLNQNIQHIMKMESYLNQVADPLAGSYAIEKMTNHLAEACWKQLLKN